MMTGRVWPGVVVIGGVIALLLGGCGGGGSQSVAEGVAPSCANFSGEEQQACGFGEEEAREGNEAATCESYTGPAATTCVIGYERVEEAGEVGSEQQAVSGDEELTPEEVEASEAKTQVDYDETITYLIDSEEGYTGEISLERAPVEEAEPGTRINGELTEGAACSIDTETDAVEPVHIQVTNTTRKFSAEPGMAIYARTPHEEMPDAEIELNYEPEGPQCIELTGTGSQYEAAEGEGGVAFFTPNEQLAPGEYISTDGFLIFKDYYSPAHPNGKPAQYENSILMVEPAENDEHFEIESAQGVLVVHGNQIVQNSAIHNAIPLLPGQSGGCLVQPPCPAAFQTE